MGSYHFNWISALLIMMFIYPLVVGLFQPLYANRMILSFRTILSVVAFIVSAGVTISVMSTVFRNDNDTGIVHWLNRLPLLGPAVTSRDLFALLLIALLMMILINGLLHLFLLPINKWLVIPAAEFLERWLSGLNTNVYRLFCAGWQIPRAVGLFLLGSLLLNIYVTLSNQSPLRDCITDSRTYQLVDARVLEPIMSSSTVQNFPSVLDSAVNQAVDCLSPEGRKLLIRTYINGELVEDAIRSSPEIDNTTIDLVDVETDDYKKAELIYDWICTHIRYDKKKADIIAVDAFSTSSGAVPAYNERSGICFDKACLFVSMCRAVDVPVRLFTGEGFNGTAWEDHSWNQIFNGKTNRWVNVDTTFGSNGFNYFDRIGFDNDHRNGEIQGEWSSK